MLDRMRTCMYKLQWRRSGNGKHSRIHFIDPRMLFCPVRCYSPEEATEPRFRGTVALLDRFAIPLQLATEALLPLLHGSARDGWNSTVGAALAAVRACSEQKDWSGVQRAYHCGMDAVIELYTLSRLLKLASEAATAYVYTGSSHATVICRLLQQSHYRLIQEKVQRHDDSCIKVSSRRESVPGVSAWSQCLKSVPEVSA